MPKTAYPTNTDLNSYLTGAGFTSAQLAGLDLVTAIAAGIADFERAADRKMLWTGAAEERRHDPPTNRDGLLILRSDLAAVTQILYYPTNGSSTTLVQDTDYELEPYDAEERDVPWTVLRILNRRWREPLGNNDRRSIRITGKWAYATDSNGFPEDAWLAMVARAAWKLFPQLAQKVTGGRLSWKEDDTAEDYGQAPWDRLRKSWDEDFDAAVARYRRWRM